MYSVLRTPSSLRQHLAVRGDRWDGGDLMERDPSSLLCPFTRHPQTPPVLLGKRRGFGTPENQDADVVGVLGTVCGRVRRRDLTASGHVPRDKGQGPGQAPGGGGGSGRVRAQRTEGIKETV